MKESKTKTVMGVRPGILRKWWIYALLAFAVASVFLVLFLALSRVFRAAE